ncbi:MAG: FHA domain-containing protein [Coprococcus sp.]
MTQKTKEQRIHYKLDQMTPVIQYEMQTYNMPFAGNVSSCREVYINGDRVLEYTIAGDMTFEQIIAKPIFRDELVEYLFSFSRQLVSMVQNGLNINKVVLNLNYIYTKLSDFTIQLVYLPLDTGFPEQNIEQFIKDLLGKLVYAHTPAIECANQIADYFDSNKEFDAFQFNCFIKELRTNSQLLIIQNEIKNNVNQSVNTYNKTESARYKAEMDARNAEMAKIAAETEAKRQSEEAKRQAELAKQAEEMRMKAEAARIEAEVARQRAEEEVRQQSQTAILYAREKEEQQEESAKQQAEKARMKAELAAKEAEEARYRAELASSKYADEIRRAKETEMRAEEARMYAEYEAQRSNEEAKRQAEKIRKKTEEVRKLIENKETIYRSEDYQTESTRKLTAYGQRTYSSDLETLTTVLSGKSMQEQGTPVIVRKSTGEIVEINKQVFCIGKADQGVDYKVTGNKSISRRHAYITNINGINYLRDNNSTNHTYLNGQQVYSNVDVVIPDNSIIRLSNEEFIFTIK